MKQADLPAGGAVAAGVGPQVSVLLDLIVAGFLPPVRVAAHLEQGGLLHGGCDFVLLCGHVLRVLLGGQAMVGERERQEVRGAHDALVEVWRWGGRRWRRQRELTGQRGLNWSSLRIFLLSEEEAPKTDSWGRSDTHYTLKKS